MQPKAIKVTRVSPIYFAFPLSREAPGDLSREQSKGSELVGALTVVETSVLSSVTLAVALFAPRERVHILDRGAHSLDRDVLAELRGAMGACGARRRSALWHPARALIAAALLFAGSARAIENKCSACRQIARRLHESSTDDKPRNALDMRSRLNSEGRREGRMIAYRESELAVHEVVDELCEGMTGYVLVGGEWQNGKKVLPPPQSGVDKQVRKRQEKEFAYFCGTLVRLICLPVCLPVRLSVCLSVCVPR